MIRGVKLLLVLGVICLLLASAGVARAGEEPRRHASDTVWFHQAMAFLAEGEVIEVPAGMYRVLEAGPKRLRLLPLAGGRIRGLPAEEIRHTRKVLRPLAACVTQPGEELHQLLLYLPDGKALRAVGIPVGEKTRGDLGSLSSRFRPPPTSPPQQVLRPDLALTSLTVKPAAALGLAGVHNLKARVTNVGRVRTQPFLVRYVVSDAAGNELENSIRNVFEGLDPSQYIDLTKKTGMLQPGVYTAVATIEGAALSADATTINNRRTANFEVRYSGSISFVKPAAGAALRDTGEIELVWIPLPAGLPQELRFVLRSETDRSEVAVLADAHPYASGRFSCPLPPSLAGQSFVVSAEAPLLDSQTTPAFGVHGLELQPSIQEGATFTWGQPIDVRWTFVAPPGIELPLDVFLVDLGGSQPEMQLGHAFPASNGRFGWQTSANPLAHQFGAPDATGAHSPMRIQIRCASGEVLATTPRFTMQLPTPDPEQSELTGPTGTVRPMDAVRVQLVVRDAGGNPIPGRPIEFQCTLMCDAPLAGLPFEVDSTLEHSWLQLAPGGAGLKTDNYGVCLCEIALPKKAPGTLHVTPVIDGSVAIPTLTIPLVSEGASLQLLTPAAGDRVEAGLPVRIVWGAEHPISSAVWLWLSNASTGELLASLGRANVVAGAVDTKLPEIPAGPYRVHIYDVGGYLTMAGPEFTVEEAGPAFQFRIPFPGEPHFWGHATFDVAWDSSQVDAESIDFYLMRVGTTDNPIRLTTAGPVDKHLGRWSWPVPRDGLEGRLEGRFKMIAKDTHLGVSRESEEFEIARPRIVVFRPSESEHIAGLPERGDLLLQWETVGPLERLRVVFLSYIEIDQELTEEIQLSTPDTNVRVHEILDGRMEERYLGNVPDISAEAIRPLLSPCQGISGVRRLECNLARQYSLLESNPSSLGSVSHGVVERYFIQFWEDRSHAEDRDTEDVLVTEVEVFVDRTD